MLTLSKLPTVDAFPGTLNSTRPRSCRRTLPQGCIDSAIPFVAPEGHQLVANLLARGAGRFHGVIFDYVMTCASCICQTRLTRVIWRER